MIFSRIGGFASTPGSTPNQQHSVSMRNVEQKGGCSFINMITNNRLGVVDLRTSAAQSQWRQCDALRGVALRWLAESDRSSSQQEVTYFGVSGAFFSSGYPKTKVTQDEVARVQLGTIGPRVLYRPGLLDMRVPSLPPSKISGCRWISVLYYVLVSDTLNVVLLSPGLVIVSSRRWSVVFVAVSRADQMWGEHTNKVSHHHWNFASSGTFSLMVA